MFQTNQRPMNLSLVYEPHFALIIAIIIANESSSFSVLFLK